MTLKEIEDAIRASLAANFTEESDMLAWADALQAERERIDRLLASLRPPIDQSAIVAAYPCQCAQPVQSTAMYTCGRCGGRLRP